MTLNKSIIAYLVITFGIFLRLAQYFTNRSLWIDEAMVSLNIINKTIPELFQKLDYNQGAPIGFLLIEKILTLFLGDSEFMLRLFPLLCGIASLFFFFKLSTILLSPVYSLCAVSLFAILNRLIYYSAEVKQYSSDVLITILIFIIVLQIDKMESFSRIRRFILYLLPSVLIWFSFPAIFVLFGTLLALTGIYLLQKNKQNLNYILCFWIQSLISAFILYKVHLSNLDSRELRNFGFYSFIPLPPTYTHLENLFAHFMSYIGLSTSPIPKLLFLAGVISMFLSKKKESLVLGSPLLITVIASGLNLYPMYERLLLFLVPGLIIFILSGISLLCEKFKMIYLLPIFIVLVFFQPLTTSWTNLINPKFEEEIKPVMSYVKRKIREDDILYVYYSAQYAYKYYAKRYGFNDSLIPEKSQYDPALNAGIKRIYEKSGFNTIILGSRARENPLQYIEDINSLRGKKRVWFVFSHLYRNEMNLFLNHLRKVGLEVGYFKSNGAYAFLYDFSI